MVKYTNDDVKGMEKVRVLKFAILGLLYRQEYSGYDITSQFKKEIGQFWSAKHSQIYPELRKLVEEDLLHFRTQIQGEKLEKKMYTITDAGRKELLAWAVSPEPLPETEKDAFMLKMYFIHTLSREEAHTLFEHQLHQRQEKLVHLEEEYQQLLPVFGIERTEGEMMNFDHPHLGHYLVLTKAIAREQSYVQWLTQHMQLFVQ